MASNKEKLDPIEQKALADSINNYYKQKGIIPPAPNEEIINTINPINQSPVPEVNLNGFQSPESFEKTISQANSDPNLVVPKEYVEFPSKGLYYPNKISGVEVEYLTSVDEDILSTPSLIENNTVIDVLLKRKIKTKGIVVEELLVGDRNAILLFLRSTSYGKDYEVRVTDPRTGNDFTSTVDLTKLKPKKIDVLPDERSEFAFMLPVRKVSVKFKMLNFKESSHVLKTAEAKKEAYGLEYNEFPSMKLKAELVEVNGNRNKDYISQFVDALPARDSLELKRVISSVTPDVDLSYVFIAPDGFKFPTKITIGPDFFFPYV